MKTILITGGAGFIGSHVVRRMVNRYPNYNFVNFDKLTYAGNLETLADVETKSNYTFVKGDICNVEDINDVFSTYRSEEHTSELQSRPHLVCRLLLEKKKTTK